MGGGGGGWRDVGGGGWVGGGGVGWVGGRGGRWVGGEEDVGWVGEEEVGWVGEEEVGEMWEEEEEVDKPLQDTLWSCSSHFNYHKYTVPHDAAPNRQMTHESRNPGWRKLERWRRKLGRWRRRLGRCGHPAEMMRYHWLLCSTLSLQLSLSLQLYYLASPFTRLQTVD